MQTATGRRPATTTAAALICATISVATAPSAGAAGPGGTYASPAPSISSIACVRGCGDAGSAQAGSVVRIKGRNLSGASRITFVGAKGTRDDVRARARKAASTSAEVVVPSKARSGRLIVLARDGQSSRASRQRLTITVAPTPREFQRSGRVDARVTQATVFFAGQQNARLEYRLNGSAEQVSIALVRTNDGATVMTWDAGVVQPDAVQVVEWDGLGDDGKLQPEGTYRFVISLGGAHASANDGGPVFRFLRHKFPVRGSHDYGGSEARFGAGRDGHTHQGQDVMAKCGTPLVAARGGTVEIAKYDDKGGNYVVVDGDGTDVDYVYMHLREKAIPAKGDHVYTGQLLGYVGDTGDAQGCHLHFELWTGPGWYEGGSPMDPLPYLKAWDQVS